MNFHTYILYSISLQKYYTGYTSLSLDERLKKHQANHQGFTGKANDWQVIFFKSFESKADAQFFEKRIKKRGASRFLQDLKQE